MREYKKIVKTPIISAIAAIGKDTRAIGKRDKLLWDMPEDLVRFKHITWGHPVIMGRKTFESIGRPLPGRLNIVVSRNPSLRAEGCIVANSIEDAIKTASKSEENEIFIIGGGEIYKKALPYTHKLYLTLVEDDTEGDTFFPEFSEFKKIIYKKENLIHQPPYIFVEIER